MVSLYYLLLKKTLRDFKKLLGPSLTLSFVMAAGVSCLIMARSNLSSLQRSQRLTYESLNFADALIPLSRIVRERVGSLENISGVRQADCRISLSGQVRLSKFEKQISARFHSMPRGNSLNRILLTDGRLPAPDSIHEAVLSDGFARAWGFSSGQQIEVFLQGKLIRLTISGLARSAEYVYQTGSATSIPDDKLFAIWWLQPRLLEQAGNLHSSCNEVLLKTGTERNLLKAESQLAARLQMAGYTQYLPRKRILSHYFLESELQQLRGMTVWIPTVFLAITAFLLNITMGRFLLTQREIIGTLRAFGFSYPLIAGQTILLALMAIFPGIVLGIFGGLWLAQEMFTIYVKFYRFAIVSYEPDWSSVTLSVAFCLFTALLGCLTGLRRILMESPAVSLIAAAPRHTKVSAIDSLPFLRHFSLIARMSIRNIARRPLQSLVTLLGLILSLVLLIFARFEQYAIEQMMQTEYALNQRQSHTLIYAQHLPESTLASIRTSLGAGLSESSLAIPVTIKSAHSMRELTLIVRKDDDILAAAENIPNRPLAKTGLTLSKPVADALKLKPPAEVQLLIQNKQTKQSALIVTALSENIMGTIASISQQDYLRIFHESAAFNRILHKAEPHAKINEKSIFLRQPMLTGLIEKEFERTAFEKTMAENIGIFQNFMIGFALLIAMGVLYNNARVQFAEREREFALLRALGFYESEITFLFWSDFLILSVAAVLPGFYFGRELLVWLMRAMESEIFRIPVNLHPNSYIWAFAMLLVGVFATAVLIQGNLHRIAFLSVLKARE